MSRPTSTPCIMYRVSAHDTQIIAYTVLRATSARITYVSENRTDLYATRVENRYCEGNHSWHESFVKAREAKLADLDAEIVRAKQRIVQLKAERVEMKKQTLRKRLAAIATNAKMHREP